MGLNERVWVNSCKQCAGLESVNGVYSFHCSLQSDISFPLWQQYFLSSASEEMQWHYRLLGWIWWAQLHHWYDRYPYRLLTAVAAVTISIQLQRGVAFLKPIFLSFISNNSFMWWSKIMRTFK